MTWLRWLVPIALASGAAAQPVAKIDDRTLRTELTAPLASRPLPADIAPTVVAHSVGSALGGPWIIFTGAPQRVADGCVRAYHRVDMTTIGPARLADGTLVWNVGRRHAMQEVALLAGCRKFGPATLFVATNDAAKTLGELRDLRAVVGKGRPGQLRASYRCESTPSACPRDVHAVFRSWTLDRTYNIAREFRTTRIAYTMKPGKTREFGYGPIWQIEYDTADRSAPVGVVVRMVAPF